MGGNALTTVKTRRYSRDEYLTVHKRVSEILDSSGMIAEFFIPEAYSDKPDFGDMDVILRKEGSFNLREWIEKTFLPEEIVKNDDVFSFNLNDFQIDFIDASNYFVTAKFYFAYCDFGNLAGRTAYSLGLKLGHKTGLSCRYYLAQDFQLNEIILSKDPKEILEYLGFSYPGFEKGFRTEEDIFRYAVSTRYFSGPAYRLENLNNENRSRNRKRPFYMKFIQFLETEGLLAGEYQKPSLEELQRMQTAHLEHFGKMEECRKMIDEVSRQRKAAELFNGNIVMKILNISGKELGEFMKSVKQSYSESDLQGMILDLSFNAEKFIKDRFEEFREKS